MSRNSFRDTSSVTKYGYLLNCQEVIAQNVKFRIKKYGVFKNNLRIELLDTTISGLKKKI